MKRLEWRRLPDYWPNDGDDIYVELFTFGGPKYHCTWDREEDTITFHLPDQDFGAPWINICRWRYVS